MDGGATRICGRAAIVVAAMLLAACGGGGGGGTVRADPPPTAPPPTPPVVNPPNPAYSRHIDWTGASWAHSAGLTGAGVKVAVVDSGVNRTHPALQGRVSDNLNYIASPPNNLRVDDVVGHGTAVAQALAGKPFGSWPGGIAPGATIISARIISDTRPSDDGTGQGNEVSGALGLAPIHQDLINRGARIMNNSWGGLYWTNPAATAPIAAEYRPFIVGHGGLVVFATGNESRANPSSMAALPSQLGTGGSRPAADLERGWLAVAALDADNPTRLAGYSNACGVAMHYCLVAPGTVTVTGTNDAPGNPSYWNWSGTSLAAPLVSGAAALVWEAFPYFSNDLVRQTLLSTAQDLGEPGVDPIFGHGALMVASAVRGPAKFDWGDVTVAFNGGTSIWRNDISGSGGLIKQGSGTLRLEGFGGYTGQTRILGGTLDTDGPLRGDVLVGPQGRYLMAGAHGSVHNQGRIDINRPYGVSIGGDYAQDANARLAVLLGSPLHVSGSARLDGGDLHVLGVRSGYTTQSRETVLTAFGGLSGQFSALTTGPGVFLQATLGYDANSAWLDIARVDVAAAAMMIGQASAVSLGAAVRMEQTFRRIDAYREGGDASAAMSDAFIALAGEFQRSTDEGAARAALDSLSGQLHASADAMTLDAVGLQRRTLSTRLTTGPATRQRGSWYRALGGPGSGGLGSHGFDIGGWSAGEEVALDKDAFAGMAFGELHASGQAFGHDRSRDRQTHAQIYVGALREHGYWLGQAGWGRYDRRLERSVLLGERARGTASEYAGALRFASAEAGYRFALGRTDMAAYAGAEHIRIERDGFRESGADGFGLTSRAGHGERTQAMLGWRAQRAWDWRGHAMTLRGYGEWQRTLADAGLAFDASFVGADAWTPLQGGLPRNGGGFGLGLDAELGPRSRISFGHDWRLGMHNDNRAASLRLAVGF